MTKDPNQPPPILESAEIPPASAAEWLTSAANNHDVDVLICTPETSAELNRRWPQVWREGSGATWEEKQAARPAWLEESRLVMSTDPNVQIKNQMLGSIWSAIDTGTPQGQLLARQLELFQSDVDASGLEADAMVRHQALGMWAAYGAFSGAHPVVIGLDYDISHSPELRAIDVERNSAAAEWIDAARAVSVDPEAVEARDRLVMDLQRVLADRATSQSEYLTSHIAYLGWRLRSSPDPQATVYEQLITLQALAELPDVSQGA